MGSQPAKAAIMLRQSPDWGRLDRRSQQESEAFDRFVGEPIGYTRSLIELWDATFDVLFFEVRQAIKEIALANFAAVRDSQVIVDGGASQMPPPALALFSDDDDWFAPDIVDHLRRPAAAHDGLTWTSVRFDGHLLFRDSVPGHCFTNNYAVTDSFISSCADWRARAGQHWSARATFESDGFRAAHIPLPLSVANKHPCAIGRIRKALRVGAGREALIALVEDYTSRAADLRLPPELAWAEPATAALTSLFAGLGSRRA